MASARILSLTLGHLSLIPTVALPFGILLPLAPGSRGSVYTRGIGRTKSDLHKRGQLCWQYGFRFRAPLIGEWRFCQCKKKPVGAVAALTDGVCHFHVQFVQRQMRFCVFSVLLLLIQNACFLLPAQNLLILVADSRLRSEEMVLRKLRSLSVVAIARIRLFLTAPVGQWSVLVGWHPWTSS